MISIKTLAQNIQDELNANDDGLSFVVFADAAEYKNAVETRTSKTRYTNCLLTIGSSAVIPTQGVMIASQNATLAILVALPTRATDEGNISAHRAALDAKLTGCKVKRITENGKSYTVAVTYAPATTGTIELRAGIGTSIDFFVDINFGYVENGLNSDDTEFLLDGNIIPYTVVRTNKSPAVETNTYSNELGKGGGRNTSFIHSFEFEMPALTDNAVSNIVINSLLGNSVDEVHTLSVKANQAAEPITYEVIFGNTAMNIEGINNGGLVFSLVVRAKLIGEK